MNDWNVEAAMQDFFAATEEEADMDESGDAPAPQSRPSGSSSARTLGGGPAPPTTTSSLPPAKKAKKKFSSFKDLRGDTGDHDDDSDKEQEYFAGGDKSALAVQDPGNSARDPMQRLIDTARRY